MRKLSQEHKGIVIDRGRSRHVAIVGESLKGGKQNQGLKRGVLFERGTHAVTGRAVARPENEMYFEHMHTLDESRPKRLRHRLKRLSVQVEHRADPGVTAVHQLDEEDEGVCPAQ